MFFTGHFRILCPHKKIWCHLQIYFAQHYFQQNTMSYPWFNFHSNLYKTYIENSTNFSICDQVLIAYGRHIKAFWFNLKFVLFRISWTLKSGITLGVPQLNQHHGEHRIVEAANIELVNIQYTLAYVNGFKSSL